MSALNGYLAMKQSYEATVVLPNKTMMVILFVFAVDSPTNYYTPMNGLFSGRSTIDTKLLSIKYGLCNFYVAANSYRTLNSESARWLSGYIYIYIYWAAPCHIITLQ
jgi:hypothetical protein